MCYQFEGQNLFIKKKLIPISLFNRTESSFNNFLRKSRKAWPVLNYRAITTKKPVCSDTAYKAINLL